LVEQLMMGQWTNRQIDQLTYCMAKPCPQMRSANHSAQLTQYTHSLLPCQLKCIAGSQFYFIFFLSY